MDRTADYSIQGFLYQFNKTLLEVLKSADDAEITVEGIIEDIEIAAEAGLTAIQCKYHETKEDFTASTLFKPLLQMMLHFHNIKLCLDPQHQVLVVFLQEAVLTLILL